MCSGRARLSSHRLRINNGMRARQPLYWANAPGERWSQVSLSLFRHWAKGYPKPKMFGHRAAEKGNSIRKVKAQSASTAHARNKNAFCLCGFCVLRARMCLQLERRGNSELSLSKTPWAGPTALSRHLSRLLQSKQSHHIRHIVIDIIRTMHTLSLCH